jgi:hypothetical protein
MKSHTGFSNFHYMCDCGFEKWSRDKRMRSTISRLHAKTCFIAASAPDAIKGGHHVIFKPSMYEGQNGEKEVRAFLEEQNSLPAAR